MTHKHVQHLPAITSNGGKGNLFKVTREQNSIFIEEMAFPAVTLCLDGSPEPSSLMSALTTPYFPCCPRAVSQPQFVP